MYFVRFFQDTILKKTTRQSSTLAKSDTFPVKADSSYPISSWSYDNGHYKFSFGKDSEGNQISLGGRNTWFGWGGTTQILRDGEVIVPPKLALTGDYMRMIPAGIRDDNGADLYVLFRMRKGKPVDKVYVVSGLPGYRPVKREEDRSGSMRPIPPGEYELGSVEEGRFGEAIGYYWISVFGTEPRTAIGIHEDANRIYSPGSAGCVCPRNRNDMEAVAVWRRAGASRLVVDYGNI